MGLSPLVAWTIVTCLKPLPAPEMIRRLAPLRRISAPRPAPVCPVYPACRSSSALISSLIASSQTHSWPFWVKTSSRSCMASAICVQSPGSTAMACTIVVVEVVRRPDEGLAAVGRLAEMLVARREDQVRIGGVEDEIGVRPLDAGLERLGLAGERQRVDVAPAAAAVQGILRRHALGRVRPGDQDPVAVVRRDGEGLQVVAGLPRRPARAVIGRAKEPDAVDRRPDLARGPTHVDLEHAAGGQARELAPRPALVGRAEQPLRGAEVEVAVRRPAHDVEPVAELADRQRLAAPRPGLPAVGRRPERAVLRRRPLRHLALEGVPFARPGRAAGDLHEGELHEARARLVAVRALGRARDVVELLHQGEAVAAVGREIDAGLGVPARQEPARRGRIHHQDAVAVLAVDGAALAGDADLEPEARRAFPPVAEILGADRDVDVLDAEEPVGLGRRIAPGAEELEAAAADDLLLELLLRAVDERQPARRRRRHRHRRARRRPGPSAVRRQRKRRAPRRASSAFQTL